MKLADYEKVIKIEEDMRRRMGVAATDVMLGLASERFDRARRNWLRAHAMVTRVATLIDESELRME